LREKEKAEKAAEEGSRAAAYRTQQQIQKALKATQKGKRIRPNAAAK
jgi:HEPN domain-containing protein